MGYRLGVDLGTTFTAAALDGGAGPEMVGLGNRALQVPSVVFLGEDGSFLAGEAAERRGVTQPERVVREFKRRIGDTVPMLVAGQPFSPQALTAKLLTWVVRVVTERRGGGPELVVLTHPANWGGYKRELFEQVAVLADVPRVVMTTEPEAAAVQYASRAALPVGGRVAVYDLGGGTFDICLLQNRGDGFEILGTPDGVEHLGGIDFDEAVFRSVLEKLPAAVAELDPEDPLVVAGLARLRRDCVEAKEALSADVEATIAVALPGVSTSVRLTRRELEQLITPPLRETLAATGRTLRSAGLDATDLTAVVLVGGSSRIPLVSHLLHSEFGVRTAMDTHPKHDVALGAARHPGQGTAATTAGPTLSERPGDSAPQPTSPESTPTAPTAAPPTAAPPTAAPPTTAAPKAVARSVSRWPTRGRAAARAPLSSTSPTPAASPPTAGGRPTATPPVAPAARGPREAAPVVNPAATPRAAPAATVPPAAPVTTPTGSGDQGEARRRRTLIGSVVAVAVVLLGVAGIVLGTSLGGEDDEPTSSQGKTSPTDTESTDRPLQAPVVPDGAIVVPVDNEGGRELAIVTTPGQQTSLPQPAGIPALPSISPGRTFVEFRITNTDGTSSMMVAGPDGRVRPMIRGDVPDGARCEGRVAWAPTNHDVAVACFTADAKRTVYTGTVDDLGRIQGSAMQRLDAFSGWQALKHVTYTHSGGVTVAVVLGDADLGLYYLGPEASEPRRLTSGHDSDPAGSPVDDRIVFQRAGDLYLTTAGKTPLDCKGRLETDAVITETELCLLMPNAPEGTADRDPTFAADGQSIAFLRTNPDLSTTLMTLALTGTEPQPVHVEGVVSGSPSWGPR